ncbi:YwiC-like family protein [Brevibacillus migulae]|uniref:YwiC-like family protein n=1 Tax=Brevibacillus migulae TaxID=1644114 RepID=UPI00106E5046|nr:YwiC-like family protein [Brevibacillus migulae]
MQQALKKEKPALVIPREHGVWAMFCAPFLLGAMLSDANMLHLLAGMGLLAGYIVVNALFEFLWRRKTSTCVLRTVLLFGGVAIVCLAYPMFARLHAFWPMLIMAGLLLVPVWFIRHKSERHFLNDLIGIIGLTMLLPLAAGLGHGAPGHEIATAMLLNILYFTGSVFFVKAVFRERSNLRFHFIGMMYHLVLLVLPIAAQLSWLVSLMFLPGVAKMAVAVKGERLLPKTVGIIEIVNVIWFLAWNGWLYR